MWTFTTEGIRSVSCCASSNVNCPKVLSVLLCVQQSLDSGIVGAAACVSAVAAGVTATAAVTAVATAAAVARADAIHLARSIDSNVPVNGFVHCLIADVVHNRPETHIPVIGQPCKEVCSFTIPVSAIDDPLCQADALQRPKLKLVVTVGLKEAGFILDSIHPDCEGRDRGAGKLVEEAEGLSGILWTEELPSRHKFALLRGRGVVEGSQSEPDEFIGLISLQKESLPTY